MSATTTSIPTCVGQCRDAGSAGHEGCIFIDWSNCIIRTSKCRTGCPTQNHRSYSECARGIQLNAQGLSGTTAQKKVNAELAAYAAARSEGIQPMGTQMHQVEAAKKMSDATGVAFGA